MNSIRKELKIITVLLFVVTLLFGGSTKNIISTQLSLNNQDKSDISVQDNEQSNLSWMAELFSDFETEESEDEDNTVSYHSTNSFELSSFYNPKKVLLISFPLKKRVKHYIVYHSWKSFL